MPRKLDFGGDEEAEAPPAPALPLKPTKRAPIDASLARVAAQHGRAAGFVRREAPSVDTPSKLPQKAPEAKVEAAATEVPSSMRKRPGRPRREAQTRVSLAGPVRVIERFQRYCLENGDITYWQGVEQLLDELEASGGKSS